MERYESLKDLGKDLVSLVMKYDYYMNGHFHKSIKTDSTISILKVLSDDEIIVGSLINRSTIILNIKISKFIELENTEKGSISNILILENKIIGSLNNIRIWDSKTGKCLLTIQDDSSLIKISPDNKIVTCNGIYIKIWDPETGICEGSFSDGYSFFYDFDFLHNGNIVSVAHKRIYIWENSTKFRFIPIDRGSRTKLLVINSNYIGILSKSDSLDIWDISLEQKWISHKYMNNVINVIKLNNDVIFMYNASTGIILNVLTGNIIYTLIKIEPYISSVTVLPNFEIVIIYNDGSIIFLNPEEGNIRTCESKHNSVAITSGGKHLFVGCYSGDLIIWD